MNIKQLTYNLKKDIRFNSWSLSFLPMILGFVYFVLSLNKQTLSVSLVIEVLLFYCSTIGFCVFGYLLNDFFDLKEDLIAGKRNFFKNKKNIFFTPIIFLLITILPWFFLKIKWEVYSLLFVQLVLLLLYSSPLFRLKNSSIGFIIDSFYAYVNPFLIVAVYFNVFQSFRHFEYLILFTAALFIIGLKNIIIHQLDDFDSDKLIGSKNFTQSYNLKSIQFLLNVIFFSEIFVFLFFSFYFYIFGNSILIFSLYFLFTIKILIFNFKTKIVDLNLFYHAIFPLISMYLFLGNKLVFLFLFIVHITFFWRSEFDSFFTGILRFFRFVFGKPLNLIIYYLFLLFKIDLIKLNMSAFEYICTAIKKNKD